MSMRSPENNARNILLILKKHTMQNTRNKKFPTEIFPKNIQNAIVNAEKTVGYHPDYLSAGILSTCATAIGNSVKLSNGSYLSPSILWEAIIGRSGEGKTHPLEFAKKPLENMDKQNYQNFKKSLSLYNNKGEKDKISKPTYAKLILGDYTPEKLLESLQQNDKGLLIFKDELIGWVKSFDRYRNGGDQQMYLELFNGNTVTVDRKTKDPIRIENANVNVLGGMQPSALKVMAAKNRNDDGFLARFLFVFPEETKPNLFTGKKIDPVHEKNYHNLITNLFSCDSMVLNASDSQIGIYKKWQHKNCQQFHNDDVEAMIQSKLETYVWRLALVIEMMDQADKNSFSENLSDNSMHNAIKLAEYFRTNAQRVHDKVLSNDPLDKFNQKQVNLFYDLPEEFKRQDILEKAKKHGITGGTLHRFLRTKEVFTSVDNVGNYKKNFL